MEHYLDIATDVFNKIKEHVTEEIEIPCLISGREVQPGDTMKLYHPADETEALRIEITGVSNATGNQTVTASFVLLEWMCRLETELDELLREEEAWMQGLL